MKGSLLLLCSALLINAAVLFAQPPDSVWSRTYGGISSDYCWSMEATSDGGFIVAGGTQSIGAGSDDAWLIKTDADGVLQWSRSYGGTSVDECYAVRQLSDGYILAGHTQSFGTGTWDGWLLKTNFSGDSLWSRTFGGNGIDWIRDVRPTGDGGFILAGTTGSFGGNDNFWLIKTNSTGVAQWNRNYGGGQTDQCWVVVQSPDSGYLLGGSTSSFGAGSSDMWVVKTNANGDSLWSHTYGGIHGEGCRAIMPTPDGGYLLGGSTSTFSIGLSDMWLVKINATGDTLWTHAYGGPMDDACTNVLSYDDGTYSLCGSRREPAAQANFWVVHIQANGDYVWDRQMGGLGVDAIMASAHSVNGDVFAGQTSSFGAGLFDFWLVKLGLRGSVTLVSPNGGEIWQTEDRNQITWTSQNLASNVNVRLNRNYPGGLWEAIPGLQNIPNSGSVDWIVAGNPSNHCRMLVESASDPNVSDTSDADFTIEAVLRTITIVAPNGGEQWHIGTPNVFAWTSINVDSTVNILINRNYPAGAWETIPGLQNIPNTGSIVWVGTGSASNQCRVIIESAANPLIADTSNANFSLTGGSNVIADSLSALPSLQRLGAAYPNPFNPSTSISFSLPRSSEVKLNVFDITGRLVKTLTDAKLESGEHSITFDGTNLPSGIYFARLEAGSIVQTTKMVLLR